MTSALPAANMRKGALEMTWVSATMAAGGLASMETEPCVSLMLARPEQMPSWLAEVGNDTNAGPCSKAASLATSMTDPPPAPMYQCAPTLRPALTADCTEAMVGPLDS